MKPLRVDTERLAMLEKDKWSTACAVCGNPRAKWEMLPPPESPGGVTPAASPICSLCFLYETKWGKDRAADLGAYLNDVVATATEKLTAATPRRRMILGPTGGLTRIDDADFILGILVVTSRRFDLEDQVLMRRDGAT